MRFLSLFFFFALFLYSGKLALQLEQKNTHDLFLTSSNLKIYQSHLIEFGQSSPEFFLLDKTQKNYLDHLKYLQGLDKDRLEIVTTVKLFENKNIKRRVTQWESENHVLGMLFLKDKFSNDLDLTTFNFPLLGSTTLNHHLDKMNKKVQEFLFPLLFLIGALILFTIFPKIHILGFIYFPALGASFLSLSLISLIYGSMNLITSIVPLLCFVLNLALGIHLFFYCENNESYIDILKYKKTPILLTISTTAIGFGSLYFSEFLVIKQFGLISFISILMTSLLTIFYQFIFFSIFKDKIQSIKLNKVLIQPLRRLVSLEVNKYFLIGLLFLPLVFGSIAFLNNNKLTEAWKYFSDNSELIKDLKTFESFKVHPPLFELIIDINNNPFQVIQDLEKSLKELNVNNKAYSIIDQVKLANFVYLEESVLPDNSFAFWALVSKLPKSLKDYFMSDSKIRVVVTGKPLDDKSYFELVESTKKHFQKDFESLEISGVDYFIRSSQYNLIDELIRSFLISLSIILFLVLLFYRDLKIFFIFLLININPIGLMFCSFLLLGIKFHLATIMTFSLSIGMVVDSSFHILDSIRRGDSRHNLQTNVLYPIILVSILLTISFLSFSAFGFLPIQEFGIALALGMIFGLCYDSYVLPKLLNIIYKRQV